NNGLPGDRENTDRGRLNKRRYSLSYPETEILDRWVLTQSRYVLWVGNRGILDRVMHSINHDSSILVRESGDVLADFPDVVLAVVLEREGQLELKVEMFLSELARAEKRLEISIVKFGKRLCFVKDAVKVHDRIVMDNRPNVKVCSRVEL